MAAGLRVLAGTRSILRGWWLVVVRGGQHVRALVCRFGTASSCVQECLSDDGSAGVRNVFSLSVGLRHWHLGRYFLCKFAFLRLKWNITA